MVLFNSSLRTPILQAACACVVAALCAGQAGAADREVTPPAVSASGFNAAGEPQLLTGTRINKHLGVETEVIRKDTRDLSQAARRDLDEDRQPAAYGVAYLPLAENTEFYARIGKGGARRTLAGVREDGWEYGAGAQIGGSRSDFRADYRRRDLPHSDVKANIFSLGFVSRF